jgi:hypothetical protein
MADNSNVEFNVDFSPIEDGRFKYNKRVDLPFDIKVGGAVAIGANPDGSGGITPTPDIANVKVIVRDGPDQTGDLIGLERITIPAKDFNITRSGYTVSVKKQAAIVKSVEAARKESQNSSSDVNPIPPEREINISVDADITYRESGSNVQTIDTVTIDKAVKISQEGDEEDIGGGFANDRDPGETGDDRDPATYDPGPAVTSKLEDTYNSSIPFKIDIDLLDPREEQDNLLSQGEVIEFTLENETGINNPTISIDGGARYSTQQVLGGFTVRQKVGEKPLSISINGVCFAPTAAKIDALREVDIATIHSNRFLDKSAQVFFTDTSTEPMTDGGAADLKTGQLLYSYSLKAVEARAP